VFPKFSPDAVTRITVWKRYNDLRKLSKGLEEIHKNLYLKGEFPKFPKPTVFGRFEYDVVEERRKAILSLLNFAALHSQLFASKLFVQFFEVARICLQNGSIMASRFISSFWAI